MFDTAVIGAGISGCSVAHFLGREGQRVVLIDQENIAAGGSGAAGAFISPKFSKAGPLKQLMDEAFDFTLDFYNSTFSQYITNVPLLHIARYADENLKIATFKEKTDLQTATIPSTVEAMLTPYAKEFESVYLLNDGIVEAKPLCQALAAQAVFVREKVTGLSYVDGVWHVGKNIRAKRVVITTGAYQQILEEPYINLRPVWGQRIDIKTTTKLDFTLHHQLSISPSKADGTVALGATHDVHYHPETAQEPYDLEPGRAELVRKALETLQLDNIQVIKDYTGLRSGSNDYLPLVGTLVKAKESVEKLPSILQGTKIANEALEFYPDLYMLNGLGGYGFVQAPYLAHMLCRQIIYGETIEPAYAPSRFFLRWAKRQASNDKPKRGVLKR